MKQLFFFAGLLLHIEIAFAQQDPAITQYMFTILSFNPAYAGSGEGISTTVATRNQWINYPGAPISRTFSIHSPFNYKRMGLGLQVVNASMLGQHQFSLAVSYAYKINFAKGTLSFGLNGGFKQYKLSISEITIKDIDDKFLSEGGFNITIPDIGSGLYYKNKKINAGLSAMHLAQNKITNTEADHRTLRRNYYLFTNYKIPFSTSINFLPGFLLKYIEGAPIQIDLTSLLEWRETIWTGLSYRSGDAVNFYAGFNIHSISGSIHLLKIGYSYDWTVSGLRNYTSGTHEVVVMCNFNTLPTIKKLKERRTTKSPLFF